MATMITEVYEAFRKVGIPDPEAKQAAEALSAENVSTKADINGAEKSLMAYISEVEKRLGERISQEITDLDDKFSRRITDLDDKLSERIADLDSKLNERITELDDKLSDRMTALDDKFSREIADVKASIAKQDREMAVMKWMIATAIAGILSLVIKSFFPV